MLYSNHFHSQSLMKVVNKTFPNPESVPVHHTYKENYTPQQRIWNIQPKLVLFKGNKT